MIGRCIKVLGEGNFDWTDENSYQYLLSLAPFSLEQFSEQTKLIRKALDEDVDLI